MIITEKSQKPKKPAIRFDGFVDPWERRKVIDVAPLQRGFDLPTSQMKKGPYPVVMSNGIGGYHSKYKVKGPGVITGRSGTIGKVHYVKDNYWPHNTSLWVTDFCGNYPKFVYYLYQRLDLSFFGTGSGVPTLNRNDVHDAEVFVPTFEEQVCISTQLDNLNTLITLHQSKYDKLVNIKKSMLEKMFPRDGADVPEVRFTGFTGAWERRKLFEIAEFNPKSELPNEFEYVDLESVVGTEMISHRTEKKNSAPSRAQRLAKTGDVFFQTVRPYQRNNHLFSKSDTNYVFSTGYAQMRPKIDAHFLMSFLQTDDFVNVVLENCTGTSYPAINSNDLSKLEITLPMSCEEQKQIGETISNLDNLIVLHQRKLEKLKNIKKSMLERMFV